MIKLEAKLISFFYFFSINCQLTPNSRSNSGNEGNEKALHKNKALDKNKGDGLH